MCHEQKPCGAILSLWGVCIGGGMDACGKESYIAGLKRYRKLGIPVIVDGQECGEPEWNRIFEMKEGEFFYMADFVQDDETGKLREIRFDRVYHT